MGKNLPILLAVPNKNPIARKERFGMENEKSQREKAIAALSVAFLVVAVFVIFWAAVTTISTRRHFASVLSEGTPRDEMPLITKLFVISIPTIAYVIFFVSLILLLIRKELCVRSKTVTLVVNIVIGMITFVYTLAYISAVLLPIW